MDRNQKIKIDVWSDYVCPFCYLEEPVLNRLATEHSGMVEIDWHAFELRPEPVPTLDPNGEYLHTVWESSVYPMARERGLLLRLPPVQPRSRNALAAAELARAKGRYGEMHHALFKAFFERGQDISDLDLLAQMGAEVGLDPAELRTSLQRGDYTEKVLADEKLAHDLQLNGVPAMILHRADELLHQGLWVSGAQPYPTLLRALRQVA